MAPEILLKENYDERVDIWSLGVTIYYMAYGNGPFSGKGVEETYENIKKFKYSFPSKKVNDNLVVLIKQILTPKDKRISLV